ncbi:MAG: alpha/beta fold hydrolase [Candidatus Paceibacterota bacterium]
MKKRVFIIHGWGGTPKEGWLLWLNKELKKKGFNVVAPKMPNADEPKIKEWVSFLAKLVGKPDKNTYFVGHSIGCQAIMRYLETLKNKKIGGLVFVSGWFKLMNLESEEEEEIAKSWIETPINLKKVKNNSKKIVAIFSDNDPVVPLSDNEIFKKELSAEIIIEHNKSHFNASDGITELSIVLEKILEMSK